MKIKLNLFILLLTSYNLIAQVGIGTLLPDPSAALDIDYTNKGILLPRIALLSSTDNTTIPSPPNSIFIYNTSTSNDISPGYYYWNDIQQKWIRIIDTTLPSSWSINGNSGTTTGFGSGTNFIGTTDNTDLFFRRNNVHAGLLNNASLNTSFGVNSLSTITTALRNTAIGHTNQRQNLSGEHNTTIGANVLVSNTTGSRNVAVGSDALRSNRSNNSTAVGYKSIEQNTTGQGNTAIGAFALSVGTSGNYNVAIGHSALQRTSGNANTAIGYQSGTNNTTGTHNSALGSFTLQANTTGELNTAIGYDALRENTTGRNNTAIGYAAGPTTTNLNNTTAIGSSARVSQSNTIQIGDEFISSISGQVNFSATSDRRYKENIQIIPLGLDFINELNPVEYTRKNNENNTKEWGIIAQELQETLQKIKYSDAGVIQEDGSENKTLSVRYNDLLAPIIKAIQELSKENKELQTKIKLLQLQLNQLNTN